MSDGTCSVLFGSSMEDTWFQVLDHVYRNGLTFIDERNTQTKEVLNCLTHVSEPSPIELPVPIREELERVAYGASLLEALTNTSLSWKPCLRTKRVSSRKVVIN